MTEALVTPTQVRTRLKLEQSTLDEDLVEYIKAVHSRIVVALGYDYPRDVQEWTLDSTYDPVLTLPGSGARRILEITENGTPLTEDEYELDPAYPTIVRRLDTNGRLMNWVHGSRLVVVRYLPARPPEALIDAELVEVVRSYRAAQSGYADRMDLEGRAIPYKHGLGADTRALIEQLKKSDWVGIW